MQMSAANGSRPKRNILSSILGSNSRGINGPLTRFSPAVSRMSPTKNGEQQQHFTDPLAPFIVQKAQSVDAQEITEFLLTDFLANEPLNAALDFQREESEHFFRELVDSSLQYGVSYIVRDPQEKNRLVAVRLTDVIRRGSLLQNGGGPISAEELKENTFGQFACDNGKVDKICAILHAVESKIWKLVPAEYNCLASWLVLSVHADYKRRGIAGALLEHRLEELEAIGCQGFVTEASALNSQKLFQKLGYARLFELPHAEWRGTDGEQVFKCKDGTDRVTLEFKPAMAIRALQED